MDSIKEIDEQFNASFISEIVSLGNSETDNESQKDDNENDEHLENERRLDKESIDQLKVKCIEAETRWREYITEHLKKSRVLQEELHEAQLQLQEALFQFQKISISINFYQSLRARASVS